MSRPPGRSLDGVRRTRQRAPQPAAVTIDYPDLGELLAPVQVQIAPTAAAEQVQQAVVEPAQRSVSTKVRSRPQRLKVVRRSLVRSGFSWFIVVAILSSGAIGLFSVVEGGRAAQEELGGQAAQVQQAFAAAASAISSNQPEFALEAFESANDSFFEIQKSLDDLSTSVRTIVAVLPGDPLSSADQLAEAGIHIATAGQSLTKVMQVLGNVDLSTTVDSSVLAGRTDLQDPDAQSAATTGSTSTGSLTDALVAVGPEIDSMARELTEAGRLIVAADTRGLPSSIAEPLKEAQRVAPGVLRELNRVTGLVSVLAELGGASRARTYAVVFQNPNELRPTGGFWGQIAFVKMQAGRVEKLDIKSIYDPAGQVQTQQQAPEGLDVISPSFALQDANWFADFATSARVLMGFLSETGDPRLDGVIALNPKVVTDLLSLTGPIDVAALDVRVSEDTFIDEAQYEVADKDPEHDQEFFPGFAENFLQQLFSLDQSKGVDVVQRFLEAVARKDVQFFFGDEQLSALPNSLGAAGALPMDGDLLAPVYANIGGGKTDQYIREGRSLDLRVMDEVVRHELTITRADTRTDQYKDRDNRSYMRIYVPEGAQLVSMSGLDTDLKALSAHTCDDCQAAYGTPLEEHVDWEPNTNTKIYDEAGHRVFANWITLGPGEERVVRVVYDVARSHVVRDGTLTLNLWRQPGSGDIPVDLTVHPDGGVRYVTGAQLHDNLYIQRLVLDRDRVVGVLLE
ncbi:MAG: DUF4012 domain-containing protein [bacterium]|nr:DUF4012 domain-containing protein [bacterium]